MGYLILARKQYENKIDNKNHSWNFGPNKNNFKKVIDIVNFIKKFEIFNYKLHKTKRLKETKVLKLNSNKAKKKLNWGSKLNLSESLKKTIEWNKLVNNGLPVKDICEKQFLMYINKK